MKLVKYLVINSNDELLWQERDRVPAVEDLLKFPICH